MNSKHAFNIAGNENEFNILIALLSFAFTIFDKATFLKILKRFSTFPFDIILIYVRLFASIRGCAVGAHSTHI